MKRIAVVAAFVLLPVWTAQAQAKSPAAAADPDRLGMTCAQILKLSSTDWVTKFTAAKAGNEQAAPQASTQGVPPALAIRATTAYGKCYEARTDRLAASLGHAGKGPLMGARGDFGDFENALKAFEAVALQNSQPPADDLKKAYAALYEKHFRYAFYMSYTPQPQATPPAAAAHAASGTKVTPAQSTPSTTGAGSSADSSGQAASDDTAEEFTKAKNKFGQLLEALPEENATKVHEAFGKILGSYEVSQETRRGVYLYAIFLLEPAEAKPFAPPPF